MVHSVGGQKVEKAEISTGFEQVVTCVMVVFISEGKMDHGITVNASYISDCSTVGVLWKEGCLNRLLARKVNNLISNMLSLTVRSTGMLRGLWEFVPLLWQTLLQAVQALVKVVPLSASFGKYLKLSNLTSDPQGRPRPGWRDPWVTSAFRDSQPRGTYFGISHDEHRELLADTYLVAISLLKVAYDLVSVNS